MTDNRLLFPNRKISETFLEFASPMLQVLPTPMKREDIEKILKIAFTVWNVVVYADVRGDEHFVAELRKSVSSAVEVEIIINNLISRKRTLFGDDQRLIGEYKLTMNKGELKLRVEARSPYPNPDKTG